MYLLHSGVSFGEMNWSDDLHSYHFIFEVTSEVSGQRLTGWNPLISDRSGKLRLATPVAGRAFFWATLC